MWFVQESGKQYPLGVTDPNDVAGAHAAHEALIARLTAEVAARLMPPAPPQQPPNASPTVAEAIDAYLIRCERRCVIGKISKRSIRNYRLTLADFRKRFGKRKLEALTSLEIEEWAARPAWSSSYQNTSLGTICSLLKLNKVTLDPPIQRPPKESRGAETCLTDEQFAKVLAAVYVPQGKPGDLVPLLKLLRECGARPAEVAFLTVEAVDWVNCCATLTEHKSKRKTGCNRTLVFNSRAMEVLKEQRVRYGSGLLFRTRGAAKAYGPNVIVKQLLKVSERVGFRVIAYGLGRHSFCTRALEQGVAEVVVAALVGHRGTGMLSRHYSHVGANAKLLRDAAERVA